MELETLYKKAKSGKIQQWKVWTEGPLVWVEHGTQGGKLQKSSKEAKPKNVGKSNETTAEDQAKKEAQALWKKKLDGKYRKTVTEAEEQLLFPMLAKPFSGEKISYPCDLQAKFDGVRCLAYQEDGEIKLKSRGGIFYNLEHIKKQLMFLPENIMLDGEIYNHDFGFQKTSKYVKKYKKNKTEKLSYYIYDLVYLKEPTRPWSDRKNNLHQILPIIQDLPNLMFVNSFTVENDLEIATMHKKMVSEGYEGSIIRLLDYPYEFGHRSSGLFKLKDFDDDEFEIIGYKEGKGRLEDCVVWSCKNKKGDTFDVSPRGTLEERKELLQNATKYIGGHLKVQYFGLTEDGLPRFPTGIGLREIFDL